MGQTEEHGVLERGARLVRGRRPQAGGLLDGERGVGQELAYLDTSNLQAKQQELLAGRDRSVAQLRELEAGPRIEAIAAARARRLR